MSNSNKEGKRLFKEIKAADTITMKSKDFIKIAKGYGKSDFWSTFGLSGKANAEKRKVVLGVVAAVAVVLLIAC